MVTASVEYWMSLIVVVVVFSGVDVLKMSSANSNKMLIQLHGSGNLGLLYGPRGLGLAGAQSDL